MFVNRVESYILSWMQGVQSLDWSGVGMCETDLAYRNIAFCHVECNSCA